MLRAKRITAPTGDRIRVTEPRTRIGRAIEYSSPYYSPPMPPTVDEVLEVYPSCGNTEHDARAAKLARLLVGLESVRHHLNLASITALVMERTCHCARAVEISDENLTTVPIGGIVEA